MLSVQATAVHLRSTLELLPRCYSSATYVNIGGRGKKAKKVGTAVERVKAKKRERKRKRKNSEPGVAWAWLSVSSWGRPLFKNSLRGRMRTVVSSVRDAACWPFRGRDSLGMRATRTGMCAAVASHRCHIPARSAQAHCAWRGPARSAQA